MNPTITFKRLHPDARIPAYQSAQASGMDLHAIDDQWIADGRTGIIDTGLAVEIADGFEGQIRPRSGLAFRGVVGILGTIDADYRGAMKVLLSNNSGAPWHVNPGDRIAQLVIAPVARCEISEGELSETERGDKGIGSTGR